MQAPKKISVKKSAIYLLIIVLSLSGTGYFWYQNRPSSRPTPDNGPGAGGAAAPSQDGHGAGLDLSAAGDWLAKTNEFDLAIFSNEKFKALKENVLIYREKASLGKKNPFKPD